MNVKLSYEPKIDNQNSEEIKLVKNKIEEQNLQDQESRGTKGLWTLNKELE